MSGSKKKTGAFLTGAAFGGLVGAGVALLYAPKAGEETRMEIKEKSIELKDKAMEKSDELRHKAEEVAARTKDVIEEKSDATRVRAQELQTRGVSFLDEQRERVKMAIEAGKKPAVKNAEAAVENGQSEEEPVA